jgi:hypothetical protein
MRSSRNRTKKLDGPDADVRLEKGIAALRLAIARIETTAAALKGRGQVPTSQSRSDKANSWVPKTGKARS